MKRLLFIPVILCFAGQVAAAGTSIKVVVVSDVTPASDVRVQIDDQRQRTNTLGEAVFTLKDPGKYTAEGPNKNKSEGRAFKDAQTVLVLQTGDLKLGADKDDLGTFNGDGGTFELTINYDSPMNYPLTIRSVNVPTDWKVTIEPAIIKPDSKASVKIIVPKGSKSESESMQFIGLYNDKQIVAATNSIKLKYKAPEQQASLKTITAGPSLVSYHVQSSRTYDAYGTMVDTDFDVLVSNNFTTNLSGQVDLRFTHDWQPRDTVDSIDLRLANVDYLTGIVNITLGRLDLSSLIQSGQFFGSYITMGQRRFDGLYLFLPFELFGTAGVESQGFKLPPAALSAGYFPNFFSLDPTEKNYDNGFVFSELKLPFPIGSDLLMVALNYAMTTDYSYLYYSPLSGNPALSANLEYTLSRNYKIYTEYCIGNIEDISDTTALMLGTSARNLNGYTWGIIDEVCIEYQFALITSTVNPFVGGNVYHPDEAQQQQGCWFAKLVNHYDGLEFTAAATNSVGDFTFARPQADSFDSSKQFSLNDLRSANEIKSIGKTLISSDYSTVSFLLTVGTHF